jgi:hypothetical protein
MNCVLYYRIKINNKRILVFYFILIILIITVDIKSQSQNYFSQDTLKTEYIKSSPEENIILHENNDFLTPAIETFGSNIFVFMLNKYALGNPSWTKISFKTLKNNLTHGFVWDSDGFEMNLLFHPYSGALSFTAARSSGLSFWNSVIFPFAGSLMWELAMETELPSSNDLINTTTSGIVIGEISYRVSSLFLDDNSTGVERLFREIAAGLLSPMHGLNRLLSGKSWRLGKSPGYQNYSILLSGGMLGLFLDGKIYQKHPHGFIGFQMNYGDPFSNSSQREPFDYFKLNVGIGFSTHNTIIDLTGSGLLWGKEIKLFKNGKSLLGIYKNFDFLNTAIYRIGFTSVGAGIINKVPIAEKISLTSSVSASAILMGGIDSPYAETLGRDYNYGSGLNAKMEIFLQLDKIGKVYTAYDQSWLYVISGAKGNEYVGVGILGTQVRLNSFLSLSFEYLNYYHIGSYFEHPTLRRYNFAFRTLLVSEF